MGRGRYKEEGEQIWERETGHDWECGRNVGEREMREIEGRED